VTNELLIGALGAVVGALLAALALMHQTQSQIAAQHVTGERAKWRDKLREAMTSAITINTSVERRQLWVVLKLNTNPFSVEDKAIVAKAEQMIANLPKQSDWEELTGRVSFLLKHDWERAKFETRWYRSVWFGPQRMPYTKT
jgi:ABC-type lipoprotein release transport system permease subunit